MCWSPRLPNVSKMSVIGDASSCVRSTPSEVMWSELTWYMWSDFVLKLSEVKWIEVNYVEVLEDKSTMHIRVTLCWGYLIVLWLFYLVCILYCGRFNFFVTYGCVYVWVLWCLSVWMCAFCNVWVFWQLCGWFGNMCTCFYCVL